MYPLNWLYLTNVELLKIDSKAPNKNTLFYIIGFYIFFFLILIVSMFINEILFFIIIFLFVLVGIWYTVYLYKYSSSADNVTNGLVSKIVAFLLLWLLLPIGIIYIQYMYNQISNGKISSALNNNDFSEYEQTAKNYIEQYKNQYPKESIKEGLKNTGISKEEVEIYLNKYY